MEEAEQGGGEFGGKRPSHPFSQRVKTGRHRRHHKKGDDCHEKRAACHRHHRADAVVGQGGEGEGGKDENEHDKAIKHAFHDDGGDAGADRHAFALAQNVGA